MSKQESDKIVTQAMESKSETPMQTMTEPVSIAEAAKSLNVSQRTVWNYIRKGQLEKVTIGHKVYVYPSSLERFKQSATQPSFQEKSEIIKSPEINIPLSSGKALVEVSYLEELLASIGQLQVERQYLLESQADLDNGKSELADAKAKIIELQTKELEARSKVVVLEKENKYIRTILWILVGVGLSLIIGTMSLLLK